MINARIAGTGSYLPEKVLTNKDLEEMVETSDEWIRDRSGIKRRHIVADNEMTSDLALAAAQPAIDAAGISADDIDLIIVATTTPDKVFPSSACILQRKLDWRRFRHSTFKPRVPVSSMHSMWLIDSSGQVEREMCWLLALRQ